MGPEGTPDASPWHHDAASIQYYVFDLWSLNSVRVEVSMVRVMSRSVGVCLVLAGLLIPSIVRSADYAGPVPGAGNLVESPCYAVFHQHRNGQGLSLERVGPEDMPNIRHLRYADGFSLNGRVHSVTTGPGAVLTLYDAKRFRVEMFEVNPDSRVNLSRPVMDSYQLSCVLPPASVAPPPPGFK